MTLDILSERYIVFSRLLKVNVELIELKELVVLKRGCQIATVKPYRGDKVIERFASLHVFYSNWTEIIAKPNG